MCSSSFSQSFKPVWLFGLVELVQSLGQFVPFKPIRSFEVLGAVDSVRLFEPVGSFKPVWLFGSVELV